MMKNISKSLFSIKNKDNVTNRIHGFLSLPPKIGTIFKTIEKVPEGRLDDYKSNVSGGTA